MTSDVARHGGGMGLVWLALALTGCSGSEQGKAPSGPPDLESAAIERGLVGDIGDRSVVGLYARDGDRLCVVPAGGGYRIGIYADFGESLNCTASGTARVSGDRLSIDLRGTAQARCEFDARIGGERITFPANLPEACTSLCLGRATFAALDVDRLSGAVAEASAARTPAGTRLCGD